jgi:hypothetical protein
MYVPDNFCVEVEVNLELGQPELISSRRVGTNVEALGWDHRTENLDSDRRGPAREK